jgi:carbon monoxide dehydrogenase subunit G
VGRIRVAIEIDATCAEVWNVVEPIERHVDWMVDAETIEFEGEQRRGVGTRFVCRTKIGPIRLDDHMRVTEWEPGRSMGVHHHGVVTGTGVFELEPIDLGRRTRFTWTEQLRFPWYLGGRLGELAGGHAVLRLVWQRNLRSLARLVESPP